MAEGAAVYAFGPLFKIAAGGVVDDVAQAGGAVIGVVVVEVGAVLFAGVDVKKVDDGFLLGGREVEFDNIVGAASGL